MNGHNLLASKLRKKGIEYEMLDNAFIHISDFEMAQKLSNRFNPEELHKILDVFAKRYCPITARFEMSYAWTTMQIECATDIVFKKQEYLQPMYDEIIKMAIYTVRPDNIATFLGQRITYNCKKEAGNNFNQRILGTRIKHHMGDVSIKMYDKFGLVLRIESTCNNIGAFRVNREVQHNEGSITVEKALMKKTIYSLYQLFTIMKAANYRYLEFISTFDDHSDGEKNLSETTKPALENGRSYRGFNFFNPDDLKILEVIGRGEFNIHGIQNREVRSYLDNVSSSAMSRILNRLRLHGLIERVKGSHRYFLTALGKVVIVAGLKVKNLIIIPELVLA
jgi:predicted transcriptional regulator